MAFNVTRRLLLGAAVAGMAGLGAGAWAADPVKVGFIYVGPVGDHGWTYRHDIGRQDVETEFGDQVETTFVENVAEGPDAERVIRQLATSGHDLIFATSFGFQNAVLRVARQFPDVKFEHATGYQRVENSSLYNAKFHEGRAVIGTIAGHMTQTGVIGYIASFPIPEVVMGINAFTLAAQKVRPDIEVRVVWVNSWYDPGKEADAAKALFDQGADIMVQHTDSPAPLQVAEERGLYAFGQASDMAKFAPNAQLTSIVDNWSPYYIERVKAVIDGTWTSSDVWPGLKEGMVEISPYGPAVPEDVVQAAEAVRTGIIDGSLHPFTGPIKDQEGNERIAAGATISDEELLKMDWFVEGVQGTLGG